VFLTAYTHIRSSYALELCHLKGCHGSSDRDPSKGLPKFVIPSHFNCLDTGSDTGTIDDEDDGVDERNEASAAQTQEGAAFKAQYVAGNKY